MRLFAGQVYESATDAAKDVLETASKAYAGDRLAEEVLPEKLDGLSIQEIRSILPAIQMLKPSADQSRTAIWEGLLQAGSLTKNLVVSPFMQATRLFMDGDSYQQKQERRALLDEITADRQKEWGDFSSAVIGAISTLPYMAAASIPYAGMGLVMAQAGQEFDRQVALEGGDISGVDYLVKKSLFSLAYASVEKVQWGGFLNRGKGLSNRLMHAEMFHNLNHAANAMKIVGLGALGESAEEGLQGAIESTFVSWELDKDVAEDLSKSLIGDFVDSLGTMTLIEGVPMVARGIRAQRRGYTPVSMEDAIRVKRAAEEALRDMEANPKSRKGLENFGRQFGDLARLWVNAHADPNATRTLFASLGVTTQSEREKIQKALDAANKLADKGKQKEARLKAFLQNSELAGQVSDSLQTVWKSIAGDSEAEEAFLGGYRLRRGADLLASALGGVNARVADDGSLVSDFNLFGRKYTLKHRRSKLKDINPLTTDPEEVQVILTELGRDGRFPDGIPTVEQWLLLPEDMRKEAVGNYELFYETNFGGWSVVNSDGSELSSQDIGKAVPQATWREGVVSFDARSLPDAEYESFIHALVAAVRDNYATDKDARTIYDQLVRLFPRMDGATVELDERLLAEGFRRHLSGVDVTEKAHSQLYNQLTAWLKRIFGRVSKQHENIKKAENAWEAFFTAAQSGDITEFLRYVEANEKSVRDSEAKMASDRDNYQREMKEAREEIRKANERERRIALFMLNLWENAGRRVLPSGEQPAALLPPPPPLSVRDALGDIVRIGHVTAKTVKDSLSKDESALRFLEAESGVTIDRRTRKKLYDTINTAMLAYTEKYGAVAAA